MADTRFNCLPTIIGSMPHTDAATAWQVVNRYLKEIPAWPQLPQRSFREDINVQYSEGFPGMVATADRIYIDTADSNVDTSMEKLYTAFLEDNAGDYAIGEDYAAGLYQMLVSGITPLLVKGQVVGPVTFGLCVTDDTKKSIIYDDMLGDALTSSSG